MGIAEKNNAQLCQHNGLTPNPHCYIATILRQCLIRGTVKGFKSNSAFAFAVRILHQPRGLYICRARGFYIHRAAFAFTARLLHSPRGLYINRATFLTRLRVTLLGHHSCAILVSRGQTAIFAQGRYCFQYKRPAQKGSGTLPLAYLCQPPSGMLGVNCLPIKHRCQYILLQVMRYVHDEFSKQGSGNQICCL